MNFDEDEARVVTRVKLCCLHCGTHRPADLLGCSSLFSLLNAPKKKGNSDSESLMAVTQRHSKSLNAVEKKKEVHDGLKHAWGH